MLFKIKNLQILFFSGFLFSKIIRLFIWTFFD